MSRIPNSAIPHAQAAEPETEAEAEAGRGFSGRVASLAELARDNPKTAIAAGAAVAAGVVAAAAIPFARARRDGGTAAKGNGKGRKPKA